jgi:hypothetical protein
MRVARGFDVLGQAAEVPQSGRPSASRERLRREAISLARAENLVDAAYSYCIVPLDRPPAAEDLLLHAAGETLPACWLIPASGELTALACCVCTIGPMLEAHVTELFAERRPSLALALDELGNEMLFAVSRRAQDRIHADAHRRRFSMAGELHAGDPGLDLSAQAAVLRLAQCENVGVTLLHSSIMTPLKSTAVVLGVGIALPPATWSRCDSGPSRAKCGIGTRSDAAARPAALTA